MPDMIGNVAVPEVSPSGTFPLRLEYTHGMKHDRRFATHSFRSGNFKIEQRFLMDSGARRYRAAWPRLTGAELELVRNFWEARKGPYQPFSLVVPEDEGTGTETITVRFTEDPLSFDSLVAAVQMGLEFIEQPTTFPTYAVATSAERFPPLGLNTALTSQDVELIPLVKIEPLEAGYPAIFVSDRRCTIDGQLYQARLLGLPSGIRQELGGSADAAQFSFGDADGVMSALSRDVDLQDARIRFSIYDVGTETLLTHIWSGITSDFRASQSSPVFEMAASDAVRALSLMYPRTISPNCYKPYDHDPECPFTAVGALDLVNFPSADAATCDRGYHTANGCRAHQMNRYFGGQLIDPQSVRIKDEKREAVTATSRVRDSGAGGALQEIYTAIPIPVKCTLAALREENTFVEGVGIVGRGRLGAYARGTFDSAGNARLHRLDGQPHHGYPGPLGLREILGSDPAGAGDYFSLDQSGDQTNGDPTKVYAGNSTYNAVYAAGTAFIVLRRPDEPGIQLTTLEAHEMEAVVYQGLQGWVWTAPGSRSLQTLSNPIWVCLNVFLNGIGLTNASAADCEATFDVAAAIAQAAIDDLTVPKVIGSGDQTQFTFSGVLAEQKALRDWMQEILNNGLATFIFSGGRLKFVTRFDAAAEHSFTDGNIIADSLELQPVKASFNQLNVEFSNSEYEMTADSIPITAREHVDRLGGLIKPNTMRLLGAADKSTAGRIGGVRLKEELGGATPAEWRDARRARWMSTALALGVEAGQGVSIEGDAIPNGSGLFRVTGWQLNPADWSIEFLGPTITDSMYDALAGPKAEDVPSNGVPAERFPLPFRAAWCPNTEAPLASDAAFDENDKTFGILQDYLDSADGVTKNARLTISGRLPINEYKPDTEAPIIREITVAGAGGAFVGPADLWFSVCARDNDGLVSPPSPLRHASLGAGAAFLVTLGAIEWPAGVWAEALIFVGDSAETVCLQDTQPAVASVLPASMVFDFPLKQSTVGLPNINSRSVIVRAKRSIHEGAVRFAVSEVQTSGSVVADELAGLGDDWDGRLVSLLCDVSDGSTPPRTFLVTAYDDATGTFDLTPDPFLAGIEPGDVMTVRLEPATFTGLTIGDAGLVNGLQPTGLEVDSERGAIIRGVTPGLPYQLRRVVSNTATVYTVEKAFDSEPLYFTVEGSAWEYGAPSTPVDVRTDNIEVALEMGVANLLETSLVVGGFIRDSRGTETADELAPAREVFITGAVATGVLTEPPAGAAGEEYTDVPTGFTADVEYGVDEAGDQTFAFIGAWTEPADIRYRGSVVVARPPGGTAVDDRILSTNDVGYPNFKTDFWPVPSASQAWTIFLRAYDRTGRRNSIQTGITPSAVVTVERQIGGAGQENAPFVTGFTAAVTYEINEAGDQVYRLSGSWTLPAVLEKFRGVVIIHRLGGVDRVLAVENDGSVSFKTDAWPVPYTAESPTVYAVSCDANNRRNTITGSTPSQALTVQRQIGGAGQENAPFVTGFTAAVTYEINEAGDEMYRISGSWTLPAVLEKFRGVVIIHRLGGVDRVLAVENDGSVSFKTDAWPVPYTAESPTVYAVSVDANNRRNTITGSTPSQALTVQKQTGAAGIEYAPLVTGFTAAVTYEINEAGDQVYRLSGSWTLPAVLSKFRGVVIIHRLGGVDRVLAVENDGSVSFKTDAWPVPYTAESPTVYAVSVDANNRRNTITGSTPSQALTVQRQIGGAGQENAPFVTGFSAAVEYGVDEGGNQTFRIYGSWTLPAVLSKFRGVVVVYRFGGVDRVLAIENDGSLGFRTDAWPIPTAGETPTVYAVSVDANNRRNTITGSTPSQALTVTRPYGPAGEEYAPYVTGFTCSVIYETDEAGNQMYRITGSFTLPANRTNFRGVMVYSSITFVNRLIAVCNDGVTFFKTDAIPVPYTTETPTIYPISVDANNRKNTFQFGSPAILLTVQRQAGSSGQEFAPFVTGFSANLVTRTDESGGQTFGFDGVWTLPAVRDKFRGVKLVYRVSGLADSILAVETDGATTFKTDFWPIPDSSVSFTIYAVSIDANNRVNSITGSTPAVSGTVAKSGTGTLKLSRAAAAEIGAGLGVASNQLYIPNGSIVDSMVNTLSANKILAGTIAVAISITSPNITSTSGSNQISLTAAQISCTNGSSIALLAAGSMSFTVGSSFVSLSAGGVQCGDVTSYALYLSGGMSFGGGANVISRNGTDADTRFARLRYSGQFWAPTVADSTAFLGLTSVAKIAIYNNSGTFIGWVMVAP